MEAEYVPPGGTFAEFVPMSRRKFSDADPQANPERFKIKDLLREIAMLQRYDDRYGAHDLRLIARGKLWSHITDRRHKHGAQTP